MDTENTASGPAGYQRPHNTRQTENIKLQLSRYLGCQSISVVGLQVLYGYYISKASMSFEEQVKPESDERAQSSGSCKCYNIETGVVTVVKYRLRKRYVRSIDM